MSTVNSASDRALPFSQTVGQLLAGMRLPRMMPFMSATPRAIVWMPSGSSTFFAFIPDSPRFGASRNAFIPTLLRRIYTVTAIGRRRRHHQVNGRSMPASLTPVNADASSESARRSSTSRLWT